MNPILVKSKTGSFSLKIELPRGKQKALHSLYDPVQEAKALVERFRYDGKGLIVALGLGLGYHIDELQARFPDAKILVIERSHKIYEFAREHGPINKIKDKVKILVVDTPGEACKAITEYRLQHGFPPVRLFVLQAARGVFPNFYDPIIEEFKSITSTSHWDKLKYAKFKKNKISILVLDFDYFLTREIKKAIKRSRHGLSIVRGSKGENPAAVLKRLLEAIIRHRPDFILTINHHGFDEEGILTSFLESIEMPVASWFVDSPNLIVKEFKKNVSLYVSIFLWDKTYEEDMRDLGFEFVHYLPLATDEKTFRPLHLTPKVTTSLGAEVGFVGNSMVSPVEEKLEKLPLEIHAVVNRISDILKSERISYNEALKHLGEEDRALISSLTVEQRIALEGAALWKATMHYRLSCVKKLEKFKPVIHGDEGWNHLLNGRCMVRPPLHYYKQLPKFYNVCKVNFNATSLQMVEGVNQRVFDVPACGGFLLTDHQKAIEALFEVGKEIITYRKQEEIPDLVSFYLKNSSARKDISIRGRKRVLQEHTYRHRISTIVDSMRKRYG